MKDKRILIMFLLVIIVIFLVVFLSNSILKKSKENNNEISNTNFNEVSNILNEFTNENENIIVNETNIETAIENTIESTNQPTKEYIETVDGFQKTGKQKALDLVEKDWGKDDSVYFYVDDEKGNGKYVVSVRNKATTNVVVWYNVDVNKNTAVMQ